MKQLPVTTALRQVLAHLRITTPQRKTKSGRSIYSDLRRNRSAVGVKVVGLWITEEQDKLIQQHMHELGFVHVYTRPNTYGWGNNGTRFCYLKPSEG